MNGAGSELQRGKGPSKGAESRSEQAELGLGLGLGLEVGKRGGEWDGTSFKVGFEFSWIGRLAFQARHVELKRRWMVEKHGQLRERDLARRLGVEVDDS